MFIVQDLAGIYPRLRLLDLLAIFFFAFLNALCWLLMRFSDGVLASSCCASAGG